MINVVEEVDLALRIPSRVTFDTKNMIFSILNSRLVSKLVPYISSPDIQRKMARMRSNDPVVWIDCEVSINVVGMFTTRAQPMQMTGLNPDKETIMSISCFVTDARLKLLDDKGWDSIIHHDKSTLDRMDEWCTQTHGASGLTAACMESTTTPEQAAERLLEYIKKYSPEPRRGLLAGNSVHCDRAFLSKPPYNKVTDYLSYRILDVSSIKEAVRRWSPDEVLLNVPCKKLLHQAREDILESIEEAKYYRDKCFAEKS